MTMATSKPVKDRISVRDPGTGRIAKFEPTAEQRQLVQNLASIDCSQKEILFCIPWGRPDGKAIDEKTLRKHFAHELAKGEAMRGVRIKQKLFDLAMSGNIAALIFLAKARLGWSETLKVEATGKDGAPLPAAQLYLPIKDSAPTEDYSGLTFTGEGTASGALDPLPAQAFASHQGGMVSNVRVNSDDEPLCAWGVMRPVGDYFPPAADPRTTLRQL